MSDKNDKECIYCNKMIRFDKIGKHVLENHKNEVIEAFDIYNRIKINKPPIESKTKRYSLCFCCGAYFKTSNWGNSKPSLKHTEKCSLDEQILALKNYCNEPPDAATLAKLERYNGIEIPIREEEIELDTNQIEEADIDDVKPVVVSKKKEPVTLYRELQPVKCEHCEELEQDAADMEQAFSNQCEKIKELEAQIQSQLGYEIAINAYKQKVERLEHAIQLRDKRIKELS